MHAPKREFSLSISQIDAQHIVMQLLRKFRPPCMLLRGSWALMPLWLHPRKIRLSIKTQRDHRANLLTAELESFVTRSPIWFNLANGISYQKRLASPAAQ
jgi:hypothetical protein